MTNERNNTNADRIYVTAQNPLKAVRLLPATLQRKDVFNRKDDKLGSIKDLMIDIDSGEICYAVLSTGGFLGIADRYFAVPWHALTHDNINERFLLEANAEYLKDAPGFDKDHWPSCADSTWATHNTPYPGLSATTPLNDAPLKR